MFTSPRPSLARTLQLVPPHRPAYVYDETLQLSVGSDGMPVVTTAPGEIQTYAERDDDRPQPSTSTKAGRDSDAAGMSPDLVLYAQTLAGRDAGEPITKADRDTDFATPPKTRLSGTDTHTAAGRDSDDGEPVILTEAGRDRDVAAWTADVHTTTAAGRDSDDGGPPTMTRAEGTDIDSPGGWYPPTVRSDLIVGGQVSDSVVTGVVPF